MSRGWCRLFSILLLGFLRVAAAWGAPQAPTFLEVQVNVPYVIQFGFGSYEVGGLSTSTYRIPVTHTFSLGDAKDSMQLKFTGFLGYTHADFETRLLGPRLTASQDYLFVLPQLELQVPVLPGWTLKPYAAVGAGYAFNGVLRVEGEQKESIEDSFDVLYTVGLGSLYEIRTNGFLVSFGSRLGWAEEVPVGGGNSQGFASFQSGLELRHPVGFGLNGRQFDLGGTFTYYHFFPGAKFTIPGERPLEVSNQYEFGFSTGFDKPTKLLFLDNPRIGASYRFGDGMTGFRVNFGFPF